MLGMVECVGVSGPDGHTEGRSRYGGSREDPQQYLHPCTAKSITQATGRYTSRGKEEQKTERHRISGCQSGKKRKVVETQWQV